MSDTHHVRAQEPIDEEDNEETVIGWSHKAEDHEEPYVRGPRRFKRSERSRSLSAETRRLRSSKRPRNVNSTTFPPSSDEATSPIDIPSPEEQPPTTPAASVSPRKRQVSASGPISPPKRHHLSPALDHANQRLTRSSRPVRQEAPLPSDAFAALAKSLGVPIMDEYELSSESRPISPVESIRPSVSPEQAARVSARDVWYGTTSSNTGGQKAAHVEQPKNSASTDFINKDTSSRAIDKSQRMDIHSPDDVDAADEEDLIQNQFLQEAEAFEVTDFGTDSESTQAEPATPPSDAPLSNVIKLNIPSLKKPTFTGYHTGVYIDCLGRKRMKGRIISGERTCPVHDMIKDLKYKRQGGTLCLMALPARYENKTTLHLCQNDVDGVKQILFNDPVESPDQEETIVPPTQESAQSASRKVTQAEERLQMAVRATLFEERLRYEELALQGYEIPKWLHGASEFNNYEQMGKVVAELLRHQHRDAVYHAHDLGSEAIFDSIPSDSIQDDTIDLDETSGYNVIDFANREKAAQVNSNEFDHIVMNDGSRLSSQSKRKDEEQNWCNNARKERIFAKNVDGITDIIAGNLPTALRAIIHGIDDEVGRQTSLGFVNRENVLAPKDSLLVATKWDRDGRMKTNRPDRRCVKSLAEKHFRRNSKLFNRTSSHISQQLFGSKPLLGNWDRGSLHIEYQPETSGSPASYPDEVNSKTRADFTPRKNVSSAHVDKVLVNQRRGLPSIESPELSFQDEVTIAAPLLPEHLPCLLPEMADSNEYSPESSLLLPDKSCNHEACQRSSIAAQVDVNSQPGFLPAREFDDADIPSLSLDGESASSASKQALFDGVVSRSTGFRREFKYGLFDDVDLRTDGLLARKEYHHFETCEANLLRIREEMAEEDATFMNSLEDPRPQPIEFVLPIKAIEALLSQLLQKYDGAKRTMASVFNPYYDPEVVNDDTALLHMEATRRIGVYHPAYRHAYRVQSLQRADLGDFLPQVEIYSSTGIQYDLEMIRVKTQQCNSLVKPRGIGSPAPKLPSKIGTQETILKELEDMPRWKTIPVIRTSLVQSLLCSLLEKYSRQDDPESPMQRGQAFLGPGDNQVDFDDLHQDITGFFEVCERSIIKIPWLHPRSANIAVGLKKKLSRICQAHPETPIALCLKPICFTCAEERHWFRCKGLGTSWSESSNFTFEDFFTTVRPFSLINPKALMQLAIFLTTPIQVPTVWSSSIFAAFLYQASPSHLPLLFIFSTNLNIRLRQIQKPDDIRVAQIFTFRDEGCGSSSRLAEIKNDNVWKLARAGLNRKMGIMIGGVDFGDPAREEFTMGDVRNGRTNGALSWMEGILTSQVVRVAEPFERAGVLGSTAVGLWEEFMKGGLRV